MSAPPVDLLENMRAQPGGRQLLAAASQGTFLVGGAVRDLLLGRTPRELDVVVEGDGAPAFARKLGAPVRPSAPAAPPVHAPGALAEPPSAAGPVVVEHPRFGTAVVELDGARIDVATARRERYPAPGALPEVEPAPLAEDLLRRDFAVNAIAVALDGEHPGQLHQAPHALEDLREGRLRVLHERSFLDDPTRLWRLARYHARLGFTIEERTAELAAAAVAGGALATVSGARIGAELRLALAEADPLATVAALERLGLLRALHPRLRFELPLVERALRLLPFEDSEGRPLRPSEHRPDLLLLAALTLPLALRADGDPRAEIAALLDRLEFPAGERDRVLAAATAVPRLLDALPRAERPSQLRGVALPVPPEGIALAGASSEPAAAAARSWLEGVRHVHLAITGADLLAAGIPHGPEIGRRLEETLALRLDGEVDDTREAQLAAALGLR